MEYYLGWMALVAFSLWVSVLAFFWAMRDGQFSDQQRARYLPLSHEPDLDFSPADPRQGKREKMAFWVISALVMSALAAAVVLTWINRNVEGSL